MVAQEGLALPGTILTNADSHLLASGALELSGMRHGSVGMDVHPVHWQDVVHGGHHHQDHLEGTLPERVYARDVIHHIAGQTATSPAGTARPDGLAGISMDGDHGDHLCGVIGRILAVPPYDSVLEDYLKAMRKWPFEWVHPDPDATYEDTIDIDLSTLEPQVVKPGYVAWNSGGPMHPRRSSDHVPNDGCPTSRSPPRSSRASSFLVTPE